MFYGGPKSTLCDICDEEDCGNICVAEPGKQIGGGETGASTNASSANKISHFILAILCFKALANIGYLFI